jgi:hypothetical protein
MPSNFSNFAPDSGGGLNREGKSFGVLGGHLERARFVRKVNSLHHCCFRDGMKISAIGFPTSSRCWSRWTR